MRIALVVHDLHEHGGHSLYSRILADQMSGHNDVTVFANRCERPDDARWSHSHVRAWRANALTTVRTFPVGLKVQANRLKEFDIQHAQGYCGGRPNVVTAHICVAAYVNSLREITARNRVSLNLMAGAESRFYRRYKGSVIAVSQKVAGELREFYQIDGAVTVVHHGVDCARFNRANRETYRSVLRSEMNFREEQVVALFVGDLTKAHQSLKALAEAADCQLVIVSRSMEYQWKAANVHFVNPTREIEHYYAAADAFVFPTTYDAFGMVVLEAMASALPVFCSDRAGAAELITSGKDGFVFSLVDWVEATAAHLGNLDSLRGIGGEAESTARQHDWDTVVRKVEQVYFDVAGREAATAAPQVHNSAYRYQQ